MGCGAVTILPMINAGLVIPVGIAQGFEILTLICFAALVALLLRARPRPWALMVGVASWLALTAALGASGFFMDFASMPPRLLLMAMLQFTFLAGLAARPRSRSMLASLPLAAVTAFQVFRLPVEWLLAALAEEGALPTEMSWHGRNFDVLTGLTAPVMALLIWRLGEKRMRLPAIAWNIAGLALLFNVVAHGMLSVPYPFQKLHLSVDNTVVALFPICWLPFFLVPLALGLHIAALLRLFKERP